MPGVSSEERRMLSLDSYMAASFIHNGEILPTFDQTTGFESASPGYEISSPSFAREDVNFSNERRFVTRSLSFGANPSSFHGDEWLEKDEGLMSCASLPATAAGSLVQNDGICALQKFLPSNNEDEGPIPGADAYACDDFRMYEFKVRRCMRGRSHDWTECPFAHPGEKARRRDPRRFHYSGTACPEFRKGSCRRGDACEFAHGVFECWLHPGRYRTQPCKDGRNCRRRVCFFAHTPEQLRLVPGPASPRAGKANITPASYDGSPLRQAMSAASAIYEGGAGSNLYDGASSPRGTVFKSNLSQVQMSSPTSTLVGHSRSPPSMSPPLSPAGSPPSHFSAWNGKNPTVAQTSPNYAEVTGVSASVLAAFARRQPSVTIPLNDGLDYTPVSCPSSPFSSSKAMVDLVGSLQHLDLTNNGGVLQNNGSVWMAPYANQISAGSVHGCSPRSSNLRHCSYSLPCTPTKSALNDWEFVSDEPVQRVESGRDLRAKIYERLSRENIENNSENSPDLGWVNELVK